MDFNKYLILLLVFILSLATIANDTLVVGIKPAPPFIIENENGTFSGVSVDLWENMAGQMNVSYRMEKYNLLELQKALENGAIDLSINPLTVTSDRLKKFNFSQPFFITSLAIATHKKSSGGRLEFIRNFFSTDFLLAVLGLMVVLLFFAVLEWLFERRKNAEEFGTGLNGVWQAFWWSAVTMTTVGYGDKSPKTTGGRIVALVWMFTAIIIISSFTASIASSLTVNQLSYDIEGPNDLKHYKTGTVTASASSGYLTETGISYHEYATPAEGLQALADGRLDAFVYDKPILQFLIKQNAWDQTLIVLDKEFYRQYYSFSFPKRSPLEKEANLILLDMINGVEWNGILSRYNLAD